MDVTIAVSTFGDPAWADLAHQRAIPSAEQQAKVIAAHGRSLSTARNAALSEVRTEWVIHLDADDELEPGYVEALAEGTADLRAPAVDYIGGTGTPGARMPRVAGHTHKFCEAECLPDGNWMVVGTAVRADLVREVGGWRDFAWSEDWDLWLRCWRRGATVEGIREAVYRAHVREDSRNRAPDQAFRRRVHRQIHRTNFPELYQEAA